MKCKFCDPKIIEKERVKGLENKTCIYLSSQGIYPEGVMAGSGVIIPRVHKEIDDDLSKEEINDLFGLIKIVKAYLGKQYECDGFMVGWNEGEASGKKIQHFHVHIVPRYKDEPLAGKGLNYFLKQTENRRK